MSEKKVGFVIYNNGRYGGVEKRMARAINWLAEYSDLKCYFYISDRLFLWLLEHNIILSDKITLYKYDDQKTSSEQRSERGKVNDDDQLLPIQTNSNFFRRTCIYTWLKTGKTIADILLKYRRMRRWVLINDIPIIQGWHDAGNALILLKYLNNKKIIYSLTDSYASVGTPIRWVRNFSYKSIFRFSDIIEFLSPQILREYKARGAKIPNDKISIAPCSFIDYAGTWVEKKEELISFAAARF